MYLLHDNDTETFVQILSNHLELKTVWVLWTVSFSLICLICHLAHDPNALWPFLTLLQISSSCSASARNFRSSKIVHVYSLRHANIGGNDRLELKDKDYHKTLDALFRCALSEKASYYKPKKGSKSAVAASAGRLTKCAEALRVVLEHGANKLKRKTLMAVIDHITQTLPAIEEGYVQPLLLEYVRALLALLSHPAVVELLATYDAAPWLDCIDFILGIVDWHLGLSVGSTTPLRDSPGPGTPPTFSLPLSTLRSTATSSSQRGSYGVHQNVLHNLLECVHLLISAPNSPLLKRSKNITSSALRCVRLYTLGLSAVLQIGFSILNVIVQAVQTEDTGHVKALVGELLPLIRHWWQAKTTSQENALLNSIQVEALKLLYNIHLYVEHLVQAGDGNVTTDLEGLCDMLWNEYSQRDPRGQLQQDDLSYSTVPHHPHAFTNSTFTLRPFNVEAERRWAVVHILAILEVILWKRSRSLQSVAVEDHEHPRKRRKTVAESSRMQQKLQIPRDNMRVAAIQLIPFFIPLVQMSSNDVAEILSTLISLVAHKNAKLSVWATIASARCVRVPSKS
jgi:serine-protein kinase ATM